MTTDQQSEHTPLPWIVVMRDDNLYIERDCDVPVRTLFNIGEASGGAMEDANAMVHALNERPNLLARMKRLEDALRKARNQVVGFAVPQIGAENATKAVAYIDAALSEGE